MVFSTITTALATKASSGTNADLRILAGAGNSVTISTSLIVTSSLTVLGGVAPKSIDLSTVTTALNNISTVNFSGGFNAASKLIQLDASAKIPALDGSLITNIGSGTLSGGSANFLGKWTDADSLEPSNFYETTSSVTLVAAASLGLKVTYNVTAGSLTISGSTLTVQDSGNIRAPSQAGVSVENTGAVSIGNAVTQRLYFGGAADYMRQNMYDSVNSSGSVTIPSAASGGAGLYWVQCQARFATNAVGSRYTIIQVAGGTQKQCICGAGTATNDGNQCNCADIFSFTGGQVLSCAAYQDSTAPLNATYSSITVVKIW